MTEFDHPIHLLSILQPDRPRTLSFQFHNQHQTSSASPRILCYNGNFDCVADSSSSEEVLNQEDGGRENTSAWQSSPPLSPTTDNSVTSSPPEQQTDSELAPESSFFPAECGKLSETLASSELLSPFKGRHSQLNRPRAQPSSAFDPQSFQRDSRLMDKSTLKLPLQSTTSAADIATSPQRSGLFSYSPRSSGGNEQLTGSAICDFWNNHGTGMSGIFSHWSQVPTPTSSVIAKRFSGLANLGIGDAASEVAQMLQGNQSVSPNTELQHRASFSSAVSRPKSSASSTDLFASASSCEAIHQPPLTNKISSYSLSNSPLLANSASDSQDHSYNPLLSAPLSAKSFSSIPLTTDREQSLEPSSSSIELAFSESQRFNNSPRSTYSSRFRPKSWGVDPRDSNGEVLLISRSTQSPPVDCDEKGDNGRSACSKNESISLGLLTESSAPESHKTHSEIQEESAKYLQVDSSVSRLTFPALGQPKSVQEMRVKSFADHVPAVSLGPVKNSNSAARYPPAPLKIRPNPKSVCCVVSPAIDCQRAESPLSNSKSSPSPISPLSLPSTSKPKHQKCLSVDSTSRDSWIRKDSYTPQEKPFGSESSTHSSILPYALCLSPELNDNAPSDPSSPSDKETLDFSLPTLKSRRRPSDRPLKKPLLTIRAASRDYYCEFSNSSAASKSRTCSTTVKSSTLFGRNHKAGSESLFNQPVTSADECAGCSKKDPGQTAELEASSQSQSRALHPQPGLAPHYAKAHLYRDMPKLDEATTESTEYTTSKSHRKSLLNIFKAAVSASSSPATSPHASPSGTSARLAKRRPPVPPSQAPEPTLPEENNHIQLSPEKTRAPLIRRALSQGSTSGFVGHKISRSIAFPISDSSYNLKSKNSTKGSSKHASNSSAALGNERDGENTSSVGARNSSKMCSRALSSSKSSDFGKKKKKLSKSKIIETTPMRYDEETKAGTDTMSGILGIGDDAKFVQALETLRRKNSVLDSSACSDSDKSKVSTEVESTIRIDSEEWKKEVKDMLIVREIVASEKSYLSHLLNLLEAVDGLDGGVGFRAGFSRAISLQRASILPPPHTLTTNQGIAAKNSSANLSAYNSKEFLLAEPWSPPGIERGPRELLLRHLPRLISISNKILMEIETSPTTLGVAQSLLAVEEDMKMTYGKWCSVVDKIQKEISRGHNLTLRIERDHKSGSGYSKLSGGLRRSLSSGKLHPGVTRLSMSDVVIMPVQRITRYHLFMKELMKQSQLTPLEDPKNLEELKSMRIKSADLQTKIHPVCKGPGHESEEERVHRTIEKAFERCKLIAEHCNQMRSS